MMSARVSLKLVSFENKYNFSTKNLKPDDFDPQMLDDMVDIIAMICQKSSKKITADWLLDNLELPVLIEFMQYVFEPMFSRMKLLTPSDSGAETGQEGTGKN
jgi:hypothetical protein